MSSFLRTRPSTDGREPPSLPGFEQHDGNWKLPLDYYRTFIEDVTGINVTDDPSNRELKVIQSRLEGCVEAYERDGSCACENFERYEHVDSLETVHELSRFFRTLVATRTEQTELIK